MPVPDGKTTGEWVVKMVESIPKLAEFVKDVRKKGRRSVSLEVVVHWSGCLICTRPEQVT